MTSYTVDPCIGFENGFRAFFQGCNVCNDKTLGWTKIFHSGEARPADPHFVAGWQAARDLPGWYGKAEVVDELLAAAADYAATFELQEVGS